MEADGVHLGDGLHLRDFVKAIRSWLKLIKKINHRERRERRGQDSPNCFVLALRSLRPLRLNHILLIEIKRGVKK